MTTFDAFALSYRSTVEESIGFVGQSWEFFARAKADKLLELMTAHGLTARRCSLLDVGCGVGGMDGVLAGAVGNLVGVDVSAASIDEARRRHPDVTYKVYDGTRLPFPTGHFDVTFAACVMHHVPPEQWDPFVSDLHRVTRAGGLVAIFEHNPANPLTRRAVKACPFDEDAVLLRRRSVTASCRRAQATVLAEQYMTFFPFGSRLARKAEDALGWLPLGAQYVVASTPCGPRRYAGLVSELAKKRVAG